MESTWVVIISAGYLLPCCHFVPIGETQECVREYAFTSQGTLEKYLGLDCDCLFSAFFSWTISIWGLRTVRNKTFCWVGKQIPISCRRWFNGNHRSIPYWVPLAFTVMWLQTPLPRMQTSNSTQWTIQFLKVNIFALYISEFQTYISVVEKSLMRSIVIGP